MILLIAWSVVANQWPGLTDAQRGWFARQFNSRGEVCCTDADGHRIDQWDIRNGHYRAFFDGRWLDITDDIVLQGPNAVNSAVLWFNYSNLPRCFIPGPGA